MRHTTALQSSSLWIGLGCGECEGEGEKKRTQQGEAKSKDNQAEAGTKPGAGSQVTQHTDNRLSGTIYRAAGRKYWARRMSFVIQRVRIKVSQIGSRSEWRSMDDNLLIEREGKRMSEKKVSKLGDQNKKINKKERTTLPNPPLST